MHLNKLNSGVGSNPLKCGKTLLIVGPQPPPIGGGTTSVKILLDELAGYTAVQTIAINTSPDKYTKKRRLIRLEMLHRSLRLAIQYAKNIRTCDAVLFIASAWGPFIFAQGYLMLLLARLCHVRFYLKPLGSVLSRRLEERKKPVRSYMLMVLRAATGVLVQTRQLQTKLAGLGCMNTHYVPGYRPVLFDNALPERNGEKFRVLFLSQILREKGPLVLLEALRILALNDIGRLECDFYGPILNKDRQEFLAQLETTPGARYCGIAEVGASSQLMAQYDILAFPTYFIGEGHPGVILEAMHAGIPVISTKFQAIPELIIDGENGFLVPVGDSQALAAAIKRLALDPRLREEMGRANYQRGQEFRSDIVVARMIEIIFPEISRLHNS